jgi:hypothetical protein
MSLSEYPKVSCGGPGGRAGLAETVTTTAIVVTNTFNTVSMYFLGPNP